MQKVHIYVVTHKEFDDSFCKQYIPIAVGKKLLEDGKCNYQKDNTGDNISEKNPNFCELTAQYWIWKNDKEADIKGLCHYRRFFTKARISTKKKYILSLADICKILNGKYDIILSQNVYSCRGVKKAYLDCGYEKDLDITRQVILEKYPDYIENFDKCFSGCSNSLANMMMAKKEIFDAYCMWLFDILFEVEKRTDLTGYSEQEARIYGYISERLLNVWVEKNQLISKKCRIINTEEQYGIKYYVIEILKCLNIYQFMKKILFNIKGKKS